MEATLHPPIMIEFTDILLGSTLPLHPYLIDHPRLSIRIIADGNICGETLPVDGDLATGIWEINSSLSANSVKQSVTLAIVASKGSPSIRFASVKLSVAELHAQIETRPDRYHEFMLWDSSYSMQFVISCLVKASLLSIMNNQSSQVGVRDNQTVGRAMKNTQLHHARNKAELPSREYLESAYAKVIRAADQNMKAYLLSVLGRAYYGYYKETRAKTDLEKAISMHEEAMHFTRPVHPQLAEHAHALAAALMERFKQGGDPDDMERAKSHYQTALQATGDLDVDKPARLNDLGGTLLLRFQYFGALSDLERAILLEQEAVKLMPDGHPDKPTWLNNLGNVLQTRFECLGNITDLADAISNNRKAVQLMPNGHPEKPGQLNSLGNALQIRFERLGNVTDLEDAISTMQKAIELTPDGHPNKPKRLNNLGSALQFRFECLGSVTDLEDAISSLRQAVQLTPGDHSDKPSCLNNLGNSLGLRFGCLGGLEDLEDAISSLRQAVQLAPDGHPAKPSCLSNLGGTLRLRFDHLGSATDLDDAISSLRHAIQITPSGHPGEPAQLSNLGSALLLRFQRLGSVSDLEDAALSLRQAVQHTPDGHIEKPTCLSNLGLALQLHFGHLGGLADLEDAISNLRQAVQLTPDGHPSKSMFLSNLGNALRIRFGHLGGLTDLEDAISNLRQAVQLISDVHFTSPSLLSNLAISLSARFRRLHVVGDLESALSTFSTAANSTSGSAMVRFRAASDWAKMAEEHSRSPLDAFTCAIDLLPQIAWLGLAVTDQHALLADVGGIVRDAVAAAIEYEEYETAVVWAEQGRSIVWQNLLGLRNPIDDLREAYPKLASRLRRIAAQLEGSESHGPFGDNGQTAPVEDVSHKYSKLALEWQSLVEEIRRIPAFEGFLKPKSFSQLAPAAHEGPVVILNVNDTRCDALVLIADDSAERHVSAVSIPLERFSHEKSKKMFQTLTELLSSAGVRDRNDRKTGRAHSRVDSDAKFKVILRILWHDVVKPVIDGLAFQPQSNRPPRIWWCATGLLAFLPIHAAGLYDVQEVGQKAADYVVSSYTPTLTAILELSDPVIREDFQVLTVAQSSAPGAPPIPKTEDEIKIIQSLVVSAQVLNLTGSNATVERVRDGMMQSNWIHLACHGQQNPDNPMRSGFLLHDKILELSEIVKMSLPTADFAFLSACQTATGDEKVADESVHLAAGMFLSGCRGVIATTWSIRDDDAPKIAQQVYSRMFKDGKPNRKEAAYALHEAVKLLRESGAPCTAWVPFIHIGR